MRFSHDSTLHVVRHVTDVNILWSKHWNISTTNYLYHGRTASYEDIKLDEVEARELLNKHQYFLFTPNIVSLSYCSEKREGKKTGTYVLHVEKLPAEEISEPDVSTSTAQGCHQQRQKTFQIGGG